MLALWLWLELRAVRARRRRRREPAYQPTPHVCQSCDRPLAAA